MLVATPNLCLDITLHVPHLQVGGIVRSTSALTTAGGKGVNVSRAARLLGASPLLVGFLPTDGGERFASLYRGESGQLLPVPIPGEMRLATIVLAADGSVTVINGRGPDIDEPSWAAYCAAITGALPRTDILLCSGSLPPGTPADSYRQLVEIAHAAGRQVIVDAMPVALAPALAAGPDLVSPNLSEAEGLVDGRTDEQVHEDGPDVADRAIRAAKALHAMGARRAVVTAGAIGAALSTDDGSWWLPAPTVSAVNPIGAGDSFAAGAATALVAGASDVDVVRRGMATASASVEHPIAGRFAPVRAEQLFTEIKAFPS